MNRNKQILTSTVIVTSLLFGCNVSSKNETTLSEFNHNDYSQVDVNGFLKKERKFKQFNKKIEQNKFIELDLYSLKKKNSVANDFISIQKGIPDLNSLNQLSDIYSLPYGMLYSLMLKESGGSVDAVSSKNATGLFQFLDTTARQFGLIVNEKTDERKDFWKSADASARYISWIFTYFHADKDRRDIDNYKYVLAAYNAGIGNVKNNSTLSIPPFKETINYVNIIIGHTKGDLYLVQVGDQLSNIANNYDIDRLTLRRMNNGITQQRLIAGRYLSVNESSFDNHHIVNKGESLYAISKNYSVSVDEIMLANNLNDSLIGVGQKIMIPF